MGLRDLEKKIDGKPSASRVIRLEAEIERLRAALKPFADKARNYDAMDRTYRVELEVYAGQLFDARKAISNEQ